MKKILILIIFSFLLPSIICAGGSSDKSGSNQTGSTSRSSSSVRYFTGDGGKNMSLAVLVPTGSGLSAEQNYLPTMVQGVLVTDLSKYSAISVLDRMKLETVLRETESGIYRDNAAYGRLGEIAEVDYALTGSITKTTTGYTMQIQIVGTGKDNIGITKASYSGTCTIPEFDNHTGIRRASLELLTQLGVNLTDTARQELTVASSTQTVNAQTAVAQGVVAQRQGNTIESLARFYEAAAYDPSFAEAAARANTMSATIRTGSLGQDIRNDIAWRDEWVKLINDAKEYMRAQSFTVAQVVYDPNLRQGSINYDRRTVEFFVDLELIGVNIYQHFSRLISDINVGLNATGRKEDWKISGLYVGSIFFFNNTDLYIEGELRNSNGRLVSRGVVVPIYRTTSIPRGYISLPVTTRGGDQIRISDEYNTRRMVCFVVRADDITDQMSFQIKAYIDHLHGGGSYTTSDRYHVQVMTREEYEKMLALQQ